VEQSQKIIYEMITVHLHLEEAILLLIKSWETLRPKMYLKAADLRVFSLCSAAFTLRVTPTYSTLIIKSPASPHYIISIITLFLAVI